MYSRIVSLLLLFLVTGIAASPPHILHIVVDDLGWNDVGYHGSEIATPHIDQLAGDSIILNRFYVTPICSPTRAGILTGRYPERFGMRIGVINPTRRHGLPPQETTSAELLAAAGYRDRIFMGKWHLGLASDLFHPLNHGFTQFYGHYNGAIDYFSRERHGQLDWHRDFASAHEEGYATDLLGDAAVAFLERHDGTHPFYLYLAFNAPHSPVQATDADLKQVGFDPAGPRAENTDARLAAREQAPEYGESGKGNTVRQTYAAMVTALDRNVGRILTALEKQDLASDTLLLFHSDNGGIPTHGGNNKPLRGNKFTTWEGGTRVVSLLRWPSAFTGGRTYNGLTAYIDLLPTQLAAAGVEIPDTIDGINLLPYLRVNQRPPSRQLYLGEDAVVSQKWKWIQDQLFDLENDPSETTDLAALHPEVAARMRDFLYRYDEIQGPQVSTQIPLPDDWPPKEWRLPREPNP